MAKAAAKDSKKPWYVVYDSCEKEYAAQDCPSKDNTVEYDVLKIHPNGKTEDIRKPQEVSYCDGCGKPERDEDFMLVFKGMKAYNYCEDCYKTHK